MIREGDAFRRGQVVELTEDSTSYVALPAGARAEVMACGPTHAVANGGGQDVSLRLLDPALSKRYARECTRRMRQLQGEESMRRAAGTQERGQYYTDRLIAYCASRPSVRSTKLRLVGGS
jgi:hypothetical protein